MKILLTGATGLIGKELGKALVLAGHEVVAVTRSAIKAKSLVPYPASFIEWSGTLEFPSMDWSSIDGVIHLMGENIADRRWTSEIKKRLEESRVLSTQKLSEAALRSNAALKFWIQGSAVGIYGASESGSVFDESASPGSGFLADLTLKWEKSLPVFKSRTVFLRTGVVISHRGGAIPKMMTPFLSGVGGVVGDGHQRMSLIHLEDVIRFILHAVHSEQVSGVYNLVAGEPISQKEFIEKVALELGVGTGLPIPAIALTLALGEMGTLLLRDQAIVSKRIPESGFSYDYPTADSMIHEIAQWYRHPNTDRSSHEEPAFQYYSEQFIPKPIDEVFRFFSEAKNLERITPEWLNFNIQSVSTPSIEKDTKIIYRLKLHGVPLKWVTNIELWDPPNRFVDRQMSGPYRLWYHLHEFSPMPGGTLMKDWVRYQLPLGKAGLLGMPLVSKDVNAIFGYRTEIIEKMFNNL